MIYVFETAKAGNCGDLLVSQHRLRYRVFREELGWSVPGYKGMEFDQFDNPRAKYIAYASPAREVLAVIRLYPTKSRYMIEELWPDLVSNGDLPKSSTIQEGSRLCIDSTLRGERRSAILDELVQTLLDHSLEAGLSAIIGVMPPSVWDGVFASRGWSIELLGKPTRIESSEIVVAGLLPVHSGIHLSCSSKKTRSSLVLAK